MHTGCVKQSKARNTTGVKTKIFPIPNFASGSDNAYKNLKIFHLSLQRLSYALRQQCWQAIVWSLILNQTE